MRDSKRIQEQPGLGMARSQIVWVTLGGIVAIGITFALGVQVGRRAEKLAAAQHEAPMDPLKRIDEEHKLHDELTFYARLTQPKNEHADAVPLATKKSRAPDTSKIATDAIEEVPVAAPASPTPVAVIAATATADVTKALGKGPAKSGEYTIQVSSFQTSEEANAYAASLTRKGYAPYVVSTQITGKGTWHRVRLGAFETAEAANAAKGQLGRADIAGWVLKSE